MSTQSRVIMNTCLESARLQGKLQSIVYIDDIIIMIIIQFLWTVSGLFVFTSYTVNIFCVKNCQGLDLNLDRQLWKLVKENTKK